MTHYKTTAMAFCMVLAVGCGAPPDAAMDDTLDESANKSDVAEGSKGWACGNAPTKCTSSLGLVCVSSRCAALKGAICANVYTGDTKTTGKDLCTKAGMVCRPDATEYDACQDRASEGSACGDFFGRDNGDYGYQCAAGLLCNIPSLNSKNHPVGKCVAKGSLKKDAPCQTDAMCADGLICNWNSHQCALP